jgi:REP element-mobilizing transposase RayT
MPRAPRLDFPGALHHVIVRGIERRKIVLSDRDRHLFLARLASLVTDTHAGLYAWALMPNHAHILLRTGNLPLSRLVQRWLGPYAGAFNRIHRRAGHPFQNRFKNILVEEEPYLLELVRYIHLNPVRSRLPVTIDSLDRYPWTGHSTLLGKREFAAQDSAFVLAHFDRTVGAARRAYRLFVREGAGCTKAPDLEGGGLRRSTAGWRVVPRLSSGRERWASDERVLGSSDFVREVTARANDEMLLYGKPKGNAADLVPSLCERVASRLAVTTEEIASRSLRRPALDARAVVSCLAVCHYGLSLTTTGRQLGLSKQSIARALQRADEAFAGNRCTASDFLAD